jgi:hypothetical protein
MLEASEVAGWATALERGRKGELLMSPSSGMAAEALRAPSESPRVNQIDEGCGIDGG